MLIPKDTKQFKKDLKKITNSGKKDINKLTYVIEKLVNEEELDLKYNDHLLSGKYKGFRDCHIEPDWILIYKIVDDKIFFTRTGSHSELF